MDDTQHPGKDIIHAHEIAGKSWTLTDAFYVLSNALGAFYESDNVPAFLACTDTQMMYDNGGGDMRHPNAIVAWRQLIPLLEQALGVSLLAR